MVRWFPAGARIEGDLKARFSDQLAEVLLYLLRLADVVGVNLGAVALAKLARNEGSCPAAEFRGIAPKPL
ncbi:MULTISPECIES: hypothetical protein [unclassified Blastococcus]